MMGNGRWKMDDLKREMGNRECECLMGDWKWTMAVVERSYPENPKILKNPKKSWSKKTARINSSHSLYNQEILIIFYLLQLQFLPVLML